MEYLLFSTFLLVIATLGGIANYFAWTHAEHVRSITLNHLDFCENRIHNLEVALNHTHKKEQAAASTIKQLTS